MADANQKPDEAQAAPGGQARAGARGKKAALMGGGVLALVAVGYVASLMAVPAVPEERTFAGPFVAPLSDEKIQVNLAGEGGRRYLVMALNAVYDAYDETYFATRLMDPLYSPLLLDALIDLGSQKLREEVSSPADREVFKQEIKSAVDPILFPVHIGDSLTPYDPDTESQLGPGESVYDCTLRGPLYEHELELDAVERRIRLDGGPEITYAGTETDLPVVGPDGSVVYVDVTNVTEGFQGKIPVGVRGRIRQVAFSELLVQ